MLDEYLLQQFQEKEEQLSQIRSKLSEIRKEEQSCEELLAALTESRDVGTELFSPRKKENSEADRIRAIKSQLEEIEIERNRTIEELDRADQDTQKYRSLLKESSDRKVASKSEVTAYTTSKEEVLDAEKSDHVKSSDHLNTADEIADTNSVETDFRHILERISACQKLIGYDNSKCRRELEHLKYFIKARIGQ